MDGQATKSDVLQDSLYLKSLRGEEVDHFPIWLMRQAGRYMKVYQEIRAKHSILTLFTTPELACEVTLQPIKAFDLDAAIIFSDILMLPHALGIPFEYPDGKGPVCQKPILTKKDVEELHINRLNPSFLTDSIKYAKEELKPYKTPLIGFAGSPFSVATYMIGEEPGRNLHQCLRFIFTNYRVMHGLLDKLATATAHYLSLQIKAGVDAIQIFDSWSKVLPWNAYKELSLPYLRKVLDNLDNPNQIPITLFDTSNGALYDLQRAQYPGDQFWLPMGNCPFAPDGAPRANCPRQP